MSVLIIYIMKIGQLKLFVEFLSGKMFRSFLDAHVANQKRYQIQFNGIFTQYWKVQAKSKWQLP